MNTLKHNNDKILPFIVTGFVIVTILVGITVFISGYWYVFDNDELVHTQHAYLMIKGFKPYVQFFSNHSSLFHWFISPVLLISGFKAETLGLLRILMMLLFALRLFFSFSIVKKFFGKVPAFIFIALLFLNPFNTMVSMQIRPDNLMSTLYLGAFFLIIKNIDFLSPVLMFFSGLLLGLAFLVQMKIIPSLVVMFILLGYYFIKSQRHKILMHMIIGFAISLLVYSLMYVMNGSFTLMFQQVFIDCTKLIQSVYNPFGFFYLPDNAYIYGVGGKPLTWIFVWLLPLFSAIATYVILSEILKKKPVERLDILKLILILGLWLHWLSLFFINGVFIQYYLLFTWFMSMIAAYFFYYFLFIQLKEKPYRNLCLLLFFVSFVAFAVSSIRGNLAHSKISYNTELEKFKNYWNIIPENSRVFPNILYRPIAYPVFYGYGLEINRYPDSMKRKMPPVIEALEMNKVDYIILDDANYFNRIDPRLNHYLESHFMKIEGSNVYRRKL